MTKNVSTDEYIDLKQLKGTRDFLPEQMILRKRIIRILEEVFQLYAYNPAQTTIIHKWNILASKYSGGSEILKETYKLQDQGQRDLGLRYDLTVPFSKMIGLNPLIKTPFKRYEIGKVFRDGPVKSGRVREFTQCDVDVVGTKSQIYDAELVAIAQKVFEKLNVPIYIEFNNRKILSGIILEAGIQNELVNPSILSIDKLKKIGREGVEEELKQKGIKESIFPKLFDLLLIEGNFKDVKDTLTTKLSTDIANEGLKEIDEFYNVAKIFGCEKILVFRPSLARGLEIYTGTVFEIFHKEEIISSSLGAGGRYDRIIGSFLQTDDIEKYPAVGISFGLDVIYDLLSLIDNESKAKVNVAKVAIMSFEETLTQSLNLLKVLRDNSINSEILTSGKLKKRFNWANKNEIPYVIISGKKELLENKFTLRNMEKGDEKLMTEKELISFLK